MKKASRPEVFVFSEKSFFRFDFDHFKNEAERDKEKQTENSV